MKQRERIGLPGRRPERRTWLSRKIRTELIGLGERETFGRLLAEARRDEPRQRGAPVLSLAVDVGLAAVEVSLRTPPPAEWEK